MKYLKYYVIHLINYKLVKTLLILDFLYPVYHIFIRVIAIFIQDRINGVIMISFL